MNPARAIANDVARLAADRIGEAIRTKRDWERAHPYATFKFHQTMVRLLPKWRLFARAHHQRKERIALARWQASKKAELCRAAEVAARDETEPRLGWAA